MAGSFDAAREAVRVVVFRLKVELFGGQFQGCRQHYLGGKFMAAGEHFGMTALRLGVRLVESQI